MTRAVNGSPHVTDSELLCQQILQPLFRDNKSGEFDLEACRIRDATELEQLYQGMIATVYATLRLDVQQQQQQRRRIDIHWDRGVFSKSVCAGSVYQGWLLLTSWRCHIHLPS